MNALLALSDVLVVRALERACSRTLTGAQRQVLAVRDIPKHHGYESIHIPTSRHDRALYDTWHIVAEIADRWQLHVDPEEWAATLDQYCRDLLGSSRVHTLDQLEVALAPIGASRVA